MKTFFLQCVLILFVYSGVFSQEKPRTTVIDGKTYFIYPYRHNDKTDYYNSYGIGAGKSERDIIPYPNALPDGDYVMYYESYSYYVKKRWFFHRRGTTVVDSTKIAAFFTLKNNLKEGSVVFFDRYPSKMETGQYKNNLKTGTWKRKHHLYTYRINPEYFKDADQIQSGQSIEFLNYTDGFLQGKYLSYLHPSKYSYDFDTDTAELYRVCQGFYTDNFTDGNWYYFYPNKKIFKKFTLKDTVNIFSTSSNVNTGTFTVNYNGWQEVFYDNGQLFTRKWYQHGKVESWDTAYFKNGKIKWKNEIKEEWRDTLKVEKRIYTAYDTTGSFYETSEWENGFRIHYRNFVNGKLCNEEFDARYYSVPPNKDTLLPKNIYYNCYEESDPAKINSIIYMHHPSGAVVERQFYYEGNDGSTEDTDDFSYTADPGSGIYYFVENDYRGENKLLEFRTYYHYYKDQMYNRGYLVSYDSVVLFREGKRFTGKFNSFGGYWKKKAGVIKGNDKKINYFEVYYGRRGFSGTPSFGYSSKKFYAGTYRRRRRFSLSRKIQSTTYGTYVNGLQSGAWTKKSKRKGSVISIKNYEKGLLHGRSLEYDEETADKWSDCLEIADKSIVKKTGLFRRGRYYLSSSENYTNGEWDGEQRDYYCNGRLQSSIRYKDGYLDGKYEMYREDGSLQKQMNYKNGWLDGEYLEWSSSRKIRFRAFYEEGIPAGEFKMYHFNGNILYSGITENGFKKGEWITGFEDGTVKMNEQFELTDSVYFDTNKLISLSGIRWPTDFSFVNNTCFSRQYYPNSQLASEGKIVREERNGIWKFYDEGGNLLSKIDYTPGFILQKNKISNTDSLNYYGYYESWYANGQKKCEAFVMDETSVYNCYQQINIAVQDLYYINYWDKHNVQTVNSKYGSVKSFHLSTGKTESEGEIVNGLRNGYWRFYDPDGKLSSVGNYSNGIKEGRWLSGDLEGMHFLDDACFDISNQKVMDEMEIKKKQISIYESIYRNGVVLKTVSYSVDLNK